MAASRSANRQPPAASRPPPASTLNANPCVPALAAAPKKKATKKKATKKKK